MLNEFSDYLQKIELKIQEALPSLKSANSSSYENWKNLCFGTLNSSVENSHIEPLVQPNKDLINLGGKRWRPLFLVLCAQAVLEKNQNLSENQKNQILERAFSLTPLVEFIHTASLIHDDIEDKSIYRRGKKAAYLTYGTDVSINAATWLYFNAGICIQNLEISAELKNQLYNVYLTEVRRLHLGQAMDISWHKNTKFIPTLAQYSAMVQNKTGTLSSLAAKIGTMIALAPQDTISQAGLVAAKIGEGFQIIDDYINLSSGNPGKKRGDDIVEGKKSLPILIFFEKCSEIEKNQLFEYFDDAKINGIESPCVEKAISLLEKYDCINQAKTQGIKTLNSALEEIEKLFGSGKSVQLIKSLFLSMIPSVIKD